MKHNILSAVIGTLLLSSSPLMASGTDSDITTRIIGGEKVQPKIGRIWFHWFALVTMTHFVAVLFFHNSMYSLPPIA